MHQDLYEALEELADDAQIVMRREATPVNDIYLNHRILTEERALERYIEGYKKQESMLHTACVFMRNQRGVCESILEKRNAEADAKAEAAMAGYSPILPPIVTPKCKRSVVRELIDDGSASEDDSGAPDPEDEDPANATCGYVYGVGAVGEAIDEIPDTEDEDEDDAELDIQVGFTTPKDQPITRRKRGRF